MTPPNQHEEQWTAVTTDPRLISLVDDALKVHHSITPPIPVFHRGHAVGVAVRLSCQPWHTRTEADGEGDNRIRMQLEVTSSGHEPGNVQAPNVPWFAYNFQCGECGEAMTARGTNLLRAALVALAGKGRKGSVYKIALT